MLWAVDRHRFLICRVRSLRSRNIGPPLTPQHVQLKLAMNFMVASMLPPNQPNSFWQPWGMKKKPTIMRTSGQTKSFRPA
jgi:hypothetical protein